MTKKNTTQKQGKFGPEYAVDAPDQLLKLEIGDYVKGVLKHKGFSEKYGCGLFKIHCEESDTIKVILGSAILDRKLEAHFEGENIIIERVDDVLNKRDQITHDYMIYAKKTGNDIEI